jgi:hypothetical protein
MMYGAFGLETTTPILYINKIWLYKFIENKIYLIFIIKWVNYFFKEFKKSNFTYI